MGNIGDKIPAQVFAAGQRSRHIIESRGQFADFVIAGYRHPHREIPLAKALGRSGHLPQGLNQLIGEGPHYTESHHKGGNGSQQEHPQHFHAVAAHRLNTGGHKYRADGDIVHQHRFAYNVVVFPVDAGKSPLGLIAAVHQYLPHNRGVHRPVGLNVAVGIGSQQPLAVLIGDEDVGVDVFRKPLH